MDLKFIIQKLFFFCFTLTLHFQSTHAFSITSQTGYELSGFTKRVFKNPDYQLQPQDGLGQYFKSNSENRDIRVFQNERELEFVYFSDRRFPSVNDVSSVRLENGKIKNQINCVNPEFNDGRACYVINEEICKNVLVTSGKKNYDEFLKEIKNCGEILNAYSKAIDTPNIQDSIDKTYKEHGEFMKKVYGRSKNILKYSFPEIFGNVPQLKSAGSVKQITDYRLLGLINTCSNYLNSDSFLGHAETQRKSDKINSL